MLWAYPWGDRDTSLADEQGPEDWQADLLVRIGFAVKRADAEETALLIQEAVSSGHGVGKSTLTAWIIHWAMATQPHLNGVVTANTMEQLRGKTWRELAVWHARWLLRELYEWTATKYYHKHHEATWFVSAVPNSERNSEAFAGLHSDYVLIIYDEASGIPDKIWEVSEGATTDKWAIWLVFGNPTRNTGRFRECWGKFRHRWSTVKIDSRTVERTNKDRIRQWEDDYGEDHDFFLVRVRGEFPRSSVNQLISRERVEWGVATSIPEAEIQQYPKVIGVDVARFGDNRSAIVARRGPKVHKIKRFPKLDLMTLAGYLVEEIEEYRPEAVMVDGTGVGAGVVDRLQQHYKEQALKGLFAPQIIDVVSGAQAYDKRRYFNVRTELWGRMSEWLDGDTDLPDDGDLLDDLTGPEYAFTSRMQQQLERKEDMAARGLSSPDSGDALAMTFAEWVRPMMPAASRQHAGPRIRRMAS